MKQVETICPGCSVGCRITVTIDEGKITNIYPTGDSENGNLLCPAEKLIALLSSEQTPITQPMVRNSTTGGFMPVSWEEALETAASGFLYMQAAGADRIAGVIGPNHPNETYYLFQKMMRVCLGTNNISCTDANAETAALTGFATNPLSDMAEHSELILLLGCHPDVTHPVVGMQIRQAVSRGATLIVAGDAGESLNALATLHLPLAPDTEVAFANGLMQIILDQEWMQNQIFAEGFGGFHGVRNLVRRYTPDRVAAVCHVDPEALVEAARLYVAPGPACILCRPIAGMESILDLAIMADKLGKPGCGVIPLPCSANTLGTIDMGALPTLLPGLQDASSENALHRLEACWNATLPRTAGTLGITENTLAAYLLDADPELPDSIGFVVYQGAYMTAAARRADVLLPSAPVIAAPGTFTNLERRVQKLRPLQESPDDIPTETEVLAQFMRTTGYRQAAQDAAEVLDEIASVIPYYGGITVERLDHDAPQWPCPTTEHPGSPILYLGKFSRGLGWFHPQEYSKGLGDIPVVILEPLGISKEELLWKADQILDGRVTITYYDDRREDPDELISRAKDAEILVLSNIPLSASVIAACPKLKMICVAFTGVDHIALNICRERGITVCNCAGYSTEAVANLVFGMVLSLARNLPACTEAAHSGNIAVNSTNFELAGKAFGIVGAGRIGSRVADLANAFGCKVLAYSRNQKDLPNVTFVDLDTLLQESDIISLHVPATDETYHMIDRDALAKMKPSAILINCARGSVIDSDALADALKQGVIAGAGIDVLESEPPFPTEHPLLHAPNVLLTPHVAFATKQSMEKRAEIIFHNILSYLDGTPQNQIF